MNHLIRYYNQNRKKIWGIVIIMASAFLLLQMVNYFYKISHEKAIVANNINTTVPEKSSNTTIATTNQSVVTGEDMPTKKLQSATSIIDNFISYCNKKELQKAYDLLTDECKAQMYHTLEVFEQSYYQDVFNGENKTCSIENWIDNTYKVKIVEDIITTGKANQGKGKQDYITVEKVNDEYKLNINNYIGYTKINKTTAYDDISMEVVSRNTYKDYEEYIVKVTNNTSDAILLDRRFDPKTLSIQDSKEVRYSSYSHELTEPMLTVPSGQTKDLTIKFYSSYVSTKKIQYIVFSDLTIYGEDGQINKKIEFKARV